MSSADPPKPPDPQQRREAKLAQALRANLRRRKAERATPPAEPAPKPEGEST